MTTSKPQSFRNHARLDPWFHIVAFLLLAADFILGIVFLFMHLHSELMVGIWMVVMGFAALVMLLRIRIYSLKVQDRVIRLEERLRLDALLPEPLRQRIPELAERQLIALRFASDEEISTLVAQTLDKSLDPKQIKERIQNWRSDHWRV